MMWLLQSWSFLFFWRCFFFRTAFRMRQNKSYGSLVSSPFSFKILVIFIFVNHSTCPIPCASLKNTPIWAGGSPFLASAQIFVSRESKSTESQLGALLLYGKQLPAFPFLKKNVYTHEKNEKLTQHHAFDPLC